MWRRILSSDELLNLADSHALDTIDGITISGSGVARFDAVMTLACERGYLGVVKSMIERGADKHRNTDYLCIASEHDWVDIAELLIDRGADINGRSSDYGNSPLIIAASRGSATTFDLLISRGADINMLCLDGLNALDNARNALESRSKMELPFPVDERKKLENIITCLRCLHDKT